MFKMLKVMDFVTLIIAVTALIISIVCMNKKCDNFGDYACNPNQPGQAKKGDTSCLTTEDVSEPYTCKTGGICGKNLTCSADKICVDGEDKQICGKTPGPYGLPYCQGGGGSGETCSFIENGRGNVICNQTNCPVCGKGCNRFYGKNGTTVCGIISENPNSYQIRLDTACSNPESDHNRINCNIPNATQSQKDEACENLCGNSSKCINGNCTMSLFKNVNM
jgi:hypothetical protein